MADGTLAIVTHNMHQAACVPDHTVILYLVGMIEFGVSDPVFMTPPR